MAGSGSSDGKHVVRSWPSSRNVQEYQVYIWRCGGRIGGTGTELPSVGGDGAGKSERWWNP
jgi:hypothetical protein